MTRVVPKLLVVAALVAAAFPVSASASPQQVILDCSDDGKLSGSYSNQELRGALDKLPGDLDEYSDCRQVISGAIGSGSGSKGPGGDGNGGAGASGGGSGNNGTLSGGTAADQQSDQEALAAATKAAEDGSASVAGKQVKPGENGVFDLASAENGVPTPLLLILIALGALALGGGLFLLRRRVPGLARISLPTKWTSLPRGLGRPRFRR